MADFPLFRILKVVKSLPLMGKRPRIGHINGEYLLPWETLRNEFTYTRSEL